MVRPSRGSTSLRQREETGKLFISALIFFGSIASAVLIFSDNVHFIRVGLVAALWVAVLAGLAAAKYRKEAAIDKAKVGDLQTVYQLQLEREVDARREHELGLETRVREEVGADAAEMAALRGEMAALRQNLQRLFDDELPLDRPALRAESTRIDQLSIGANGSGELAELDSNGVAGSGGAIADATGWTEAVDAWTDNAVRLSRAADRWPGSQRPSGDPIPAADTAHRTPVRFAGPDDDPVTAETAIVVDDEPAPAGLGAQWGNSWESSPVTGDGSEVGAAAAGPRTKPTLGTAASRRHRRASSDPEATRRLSVAEIMANLQSEDQQRAR